MKSLNGSKTNMTITYVPHGINSEVFTPTDVPQAFKDKVFCGKKYEFVLFWMNRNIKENNHRM